VNPPPSQPALLAAKARSTVIVRRAIAAAPKKNRAATNRTRAIPEYFVMRGDIQSRARLVLPEAGLSV
jgi:hypothetical protein